MNESRNKIPFGQFLLGVVGLLLLCSVLVFIFLVALGTIVLIPQTPLPIVMLCVGVIGILFILGAATFPTEQSEKKMGRRGENLGE